MCSHSSSCRCALGWPPHSASALKPINGFEITAKPADPAFDRIHPASDVPGQRTVGCLQGPGAESVKRTDMGKRFFIVLIIFILFVSGCYDKADVSSPSGYRRGNITFLYPGNWEVTQDAGRNDFRYLFVESPGDAIMIIQLYLKQDALNLRDFVEQFAGKTEYEIPLGKSDNNYISTVVKTTAAGRKTGLRERFALVIGDVQMTHIREYVRLEMKNNVIFLISQAPEEDSERVAPGFNLILESFTLD